MSFGHSSRDFGPWTLDPDCATVCPVSLLNHRILCALLALSLSTGCSSLIRKSAVRSMSGMFAGSGASVYASDDDPELVRDALPFVLKTLEMLVKEDPGNLPLRGAAAASFVQYANAFVEAGPADAAKPSFDQAQRNKLRACRLYLRGRNYALDGLEQKYPGFQEQLRKTPQEAVARLTKDDVPLAFWAGAGWTAAIAAQPSDMALVGEMPIVGAVMQRVLDLDESFADGAVHEFFIAYEGGRSEAMGGSPERARKHFDRAVELTKGLKASPYVTLAESVAVKKQDLAEFKDLLNRALAVDVNKKPEWRLANVLAQEKARRLLTQIPDLFVDYEETKP